MAKAENRFRKFGDRTRYPFETGPDGPVKQAMKAECDINTIMARYRETGVITHGTLRAARYDDVSEMPEDYQDALEQVRAGDEAFQALPADVRLEFENDPAAFFEFAQDPTNYSRMVELGLLPPRPVEADAEPGGTPSPGTGDNGTPPSGDAPTGA